MLEVMEDPGVAVVMGAFAGWRGGCAGMLFAFRLSCIWFGFAALSGLFLVREFAVGAQKMRNQEDFNEPVAVHEEHEAGDENMEADPPAGFLHARRRLC